MDGTFLLSITGQLEWVDIVASAGTAWHCKYEIVAGRDWKVLNGLEAGVSQNALVSTNNDKIVFNFPLDITYQSTNPSGWPQIVLSLYSGTTLQGYGRIHIPLIPGLHNITVPLSKPQPSTVLGYLDSFFGYQPELVQASLLAEGTGNHLIRMASNGHANLSINVISKGMKTLGYDVGSNKTTSQLILNKI